MSEKYYTDEYDEEEEYDKHALPDIVQEILDQRHAINYPDQSPEDRKVIGTKTLTMPTSMASASQEVVDALKQHIKAGLFRPENDGGYITLLQVRLILQVSANRNVFLVPCSFLGKKRRVV